MERNEDPLPPQPFAHPQAEAQTPDPENPSWSETQADTAQESRGHLSCDQAQVSPTIETILHPLPKANNWLLTPM